MSDRDSKVRLQRILELLRGRSAEDLDYEALKAEASTPAALAELLAVGIAELDEARTRPKVGVGVLVRRNGGQELLMGRRKGAHGAGTWSVLGGHLEVGESIQCTASRELQEETGIYVRPDMLNVLDTFTYVDMGPGRSYVTLYAAFDFMRGSVEVELREPDKFEELRWVKKGEGLPAPVFKPLLALVNKLGSSSRLWSAGRSGGIYVASKTKHAAMWRDLRASGVPIISTWIDEAGEGETKDWEDLWDRCLDEASSATAVVVYAEPGEHLKGVFAEVGAALQAGVPVYWAGPELASVCKHRLVSMCPDLNTALRLAVENA